MYFGIQSPAVSKKCPTVSNKGSENIILPYRARRLATAPNTMYGTANAGPFKAQNGKYASGVRAPTATPPMRINVIIIRSTSVS